MKTLFSCIVLSLFFSGGVSAQDEISPTETKPTFERPKTRVDRLSKALTYATVSTQDPKRFPHDAFDAFEIYLENTFPKMHAQLKKENTASMGFSLSGRDQTPQLQTRLIYGASRCCSCP